MSSHLELYFVCYVGLYILLVDHSELIVPGILVKRRLAIQWVLPGLFPLEFSIIAPCHAPHVCLVPNMHREYLE